MTMWNRRRGNLIGRPSQVLVQDPVNGDMCRFNGTDWVRVPKGSAAQVLTMVGGVPTFTVASSITRDDLGLGVGDSPTFAGALFTGPVVGVSPVNANQMVIKSYADALVNGVKWQDSVLDEDLIAPPGGETEGDRYIVGAGATGDWSGKDDDIAEWNGARWDFITPVEGFACWIEDENLLYVFNGSAWVAFGSTISHANLNDLDYASSGHTGFAEQGGAIAGTQIILASQVAGDTMYYNGTAWIRLAKGAALQVLQMNAGGTEPEWVTPSGGGSVWTDRGDVASADFTESDLNQTGGAGGVLDFSPIIGTGAKLVLSGVFINATLSSNDWWWQTNGNTNSKNRAVYESQGAGSSVAYSFWVHTDVDGKVEYRLYAPDATSITVTIRGWFG